MSLASTNRGLASFLDLNYGSSMNRLIKRPTAQFMSLCFIGLCLTVGFLSIGQPSNTTPAGEALNLPAKAARIVSLDFCADQYVLKLIEPERIAALSPDARKPISYLKDKAQNIPSVRPRAEDVLRLKPDLIVRSYGGGASAGRFYQQAGIPVINIGWAGDFGGIKTVTQDVADALGETERGAEIIADMTARLAAIPARTQKSEALYMTPSGTTAGAGSLVHEVLTAAGHENFQQQSGWRDIPLERLAYEQPDIIAAAFFDTNTENAWSAMRHPIARAQLRNQPTAQLNGSWMSCGAWFAVDAVEALAK